MATGAASLDCFRHHGGRIDAARLLFPEAPAEWIDLSTGISPRACPISGDAVAASRTLPGPGDLAAVEQAAAISFGVADAAAVVAVPGTDLALRLLGVLLAVPRIAALVPGYGGHIAAWGERLVTPIAADDLEGAADTHDALILANPNNPDGRRFTRARLLDLADRLARGSAWLIVIGFVGHGLKDLWQHRSHFVANTQWWPPFCMSVDFVAAAIIAVAIVSGVTFHQ